MLRAVFGRVVNVYGWQGADLLLGDIEPDTDIDPGHRTNRDSDFLPAPQVPSCRST
jgi:hypothetical protein